MKIKFPALIVCAAVMAAAAVRVSASDVAFKGLVYTDYFACVEPSAGFDSVRLRVGFLPVFDASLFDSKLDIFVSGDFYFQPLKDMLYSQPQYMIKEAYLHVPYDNFDMYIGQRLVTFGMTDVYSPLNCVGSDHIYKLSLDDALLGRRADAMVHLKYYPTFDDTVEFVYIPFPRTDYEESKKVNLSDTVSADLSYPAYLTDASHSVFAVYTHFSESVDLQLLYGCYMDSLANLDFSAVTFSGSVLSGTVVPKYSRVHTAGAAVSARVGTYVLTEEAALNITEDWSGTDIGMKNSDATLNTQFTAMLPNNTLAQINMIYQYIINFENSGTVYSDEADKMLKGEAGKYFTQPVEHILFFIGTVRTSFFREKLSVALNAGFFFSADVYIAPRVSWKFSDNITLEAGADIWTGEPSKFALARGNIYDNAYLRLKYEF